MSQVITPAIKSSEINTPISPELFSDHADASFWIGRVSVAGEVENADYFDAVAHFRANVYVDELSFLPKEVVDVYGREFDEDDKRSTQFMAVENQLNDQQAKVIGSGRLIIKRTTDDSLPIEEYFPHIFHTSPAEENSVEVSRFIARYAKDRSLQRLASLAMIRAMTFEALGMEAPATYCMIEKPLSKLLSRIGIPLQELGEPKIVDELGGVLYPVQIDTPQIIRNALSGDKKHQLLGAMFRDDIDNRGLGYYSDSFIGGRDE